LQMPNYRYSKRNNYWWRVQWNMDIWSASGRCQCQCTC
jgi:hypothetical protein